jgi:hypothetical protein
VGNRRYVKQLSALAAVAVLSGCAASSSHPKSAPAAPVASSTPSATSSGGGSAAQTPAQLGDVLESVALRASDLNSGYTVELIPDGDQVAGQVTLDNCGYNFTTEAHRVARRQYDVLEGSNDTGLMNELVAYDTPAQAAKALAQWHAAAAHCPHTTIHSKVAAVPPMIEKILRDQRDLPGLPSSPNEFTVMSGKVQGQGTLYDLAILQVRGRFLDNIYLNSDRPFTTRETDVAAGLAVTTGKRLATLAASPGSA